MFTFHLTILSLSSLGSALKQSEDSLDKKIFHHHYHGCVCFGLFKMAEIKWLVALSLSPSSWSQLTHFLRIPLPEKIENFKMNVFNCQKCCISFAWKILVFRIKMMMKRMRNRILTLSLMFVLREPMAIKTIVSALPEISVSYSSSGLRK